MSDNSMKTEQRNHLMDLVKGIAALCIVLVHFPFPGIFGASLACIGVCGVVFFFLISGYYAFDQDDEAACRKLVKRFKKNLIITLIAVLVYAAYTVIEQAVLGTMDLWLENFTNPWLIPRMIVLGDFSFIHGDPLWFMPALLYSYLILYFLHKRKIGKYAYILLPLLLLLRIGTETYTNSYGADWHLSGNFLVGALPIMLLGHYIAGKKDNFSKLPLYLTASYTVFAAVLMLISANVPVFGLDISQVFKIWCAVEVFLLTLRLSGKKPVPFMGRVGDKYSLTIYISHNLIGTFISLILIRPDAPSWLRSWVLPIIVICASLLTAAVWDHIKKMRAGKKKV